MILENWRNARIINRYNKILNHLQSEAKERKIRVIFLNCEASKWAYQFIYENFAKDSRFEVQILISVYDLLLNKKYAYLNYEKQLEKNYNFFKELGMNVTYAYDFKKKKPIDLKQFAPDIIFYDEPQSVPKIQSIDKTCKYSIPLYCSYGSCISNGSNEQDKVYKKLFMYFIDNEFTKTLLQKFGMKEEQIFVAGQPKIDSYLKPIKYENQIWKTDKKRIIYAPHFSFDKSSELRFGTFDKNYKFFYNYAKSHQEYEFIIKPHPSLKREIVKRGLMSFDEMQKYFENWSALSNAQIFEGGNYIDMFRTSDLLITDCNSFLYEYLPTEKPVIHLINENSVGQNEFGIKLIEGYYKAKNNEDVGNYLDNILVKNEDPMYPKRKEIIKNYLPLSNGGTAELVFNYVQSILFKEKEA